MTSHAPHLKLPSAPKVKWSNPITRGLVGYWPLSDGGGLVARDIAGSLQGSITGAINQGVATNGRALVNPTGAAARIAMPYSLNIKALDNHDRSISAWIYREASPPSHMVWFSVNPSVDAPLYMLITADGKLYRWSRQGWTWSILLAIGRWQHVVYSFKSTGTNQGVEKFYIDGSLAVSHGDTSLAMPVWSDTNATLFSNQTGDFPHKGGLSNVALFSRTLTQRDAQDLYVNPLAMIDTGVEVWSTLPDVGGFNPAFVQPYQVLQ